MENNSSFLTSEYTEVDGFLMCFEFKKKKNKKTNKQPSAKNLEFQAQLTVILCPASSLQKEASILSKEDRPA